MPFKLPGITSSHHNFEDIVNVKKLLEHIPQKMVDYSKQTLFEFFDIFRRCTLIVELPPLPTQSLRARTRARTYVGTYVALEWAGLLRQTMY